MRINPLEKHFTTRQVAEMWGVTVFSVIRLFQDEPGVLRLGSLNERRRTRRELRIPQSVMQRVNRK